MIIGLAAVVALLYFWLKAHWFAAVLATPLLAWLGLMLHLLTLESSPDSLSGELFGLGGGAAFAWLPIAVR